MPSSSVGIALSFFLIKKKHRICASSSCIVANTAYGHFWASVSNRNKMGSRKNISKTSKEFHREAQRLGPVMSPQVRFNDKAAL